MCGWRVFFVVVDRYAIVSFDLFWFSDWGGEGRGNSMGLILEARSPFSFPFYYQVCCLNLMYLQSSVVLLS